MSKEPLQYRPYEYNNMCLRCWIPYPKNMIRCEVCHLLLRTKGKDRRTYKENPHRY